MSGRWLLWIYCVIYGSTYEPFMAASMNVQTIEDNCVLSFIIPRDKMKSSCDHEDQVNRHVNAMEMKVNLYKQQVNDLQIQLDKMRQLNNDRYQLLERQVTAISAHMDMNFLLEHKVNRIEADVQQLNTDIAAVKKTMPGRTQSTHQEDQTASSDWNGSVLPHNIQSMIQHEVKLYGDEFTSMFQTYVLEQIMLYNKVFNNRLHENGASQHMHKNFTQSKLSLLKNSGDTVERLKRLIGRDGMLSQEYENLKVDDISYQTEKHISSNRKKLARDESLNVTGFAQAVPSTIRRRKRHHVVRNSQPEDIDEANENNESFSGENPDVNDTTLDDSISSMEQEVSSRSSSRISQTYESDANSTRTQVGHNDSEEKWALKSHLDQCYNKINDVERKLRKEITDIIYTPLGEVVRLVEKLKSDMEEQILNQDHKCRQANEQLTVHLTEVQNSVRATNLQLRGVAQDVQESMAKIDKVRQLEDLVSDLIVNVTTNSRSQSDLEIEEQAKRIKKLERLMSVYQLSLQHYRNETKHEYREMSVSFEKESNALKIFIKALHTNLNETVRNEMNILNSSYNKRLQEVNEQIRGYEDSLMHVQMDIQKAEKRLESKSKRSDRDYDDMQETIHQITLKQKDFKKKLENIEQVQGSMHDRLNSYAKNMQSLQTEAKVNTHEWLPLTFEFDSSRTECFGDQYVKRTHYTKAKYVGVVLCSETRYKIFLSSSLNATFMNVGDANGLGEDHCEFVGARRDAHVKLSAFMIKYSSMQGYVRNHWGQEPAVTHLNAIKPSPHWYECGVKIP